MHFKFRLLIFVYPACLMIMYFDIKTYFRPNFACITISIQTKTYSTYGMIEFTAVFGPAIIYLIKMALLLNLLFLYLSILFINLCQCILKSS